MRENCQFCNGEFRLNVVACRQTKTKYLRAGCCDGALRPCPDPVDLLRYAKLTQDERDYLQRIENLDWFGGRVASVLLKIEARVKASMEATNA